MKDTYYFSHDANALSDPKILSMRCDYGLEGYGLYWAIIELLRNESNYKLSLNKTTYKAIKMQTGTSIEVEKFIENCIKEYVDSETGNGLFNSDGILFWSASLLRRMEKYEEIKEKRSQAANKRWNNKKDKKNASVCKSKRKLCKSNANAYKSVYKCNAKSQKPYAKLCKLNKNKLNKIKLNKIKSIYPSIDGMDKTDLKIDNEEFEKIIEQSNVKLFDEKLSQEIITVMKELYTDTETKKQLLNISIYDIDYALKNYSYKNSKEKIQKPKEYFKKCLLSALEQSALINQYDLTACYENNGGGNDGI